MTGRSVCPVCGGELVETFSDETRVVKSCLDCGQDQVSDASTEEAEHADHD